MANALLSFRDVVGVSQEGPLDPAFPVSFELMQGEIGVIRGGIRASSLIRLAAGRGIVMKGAMSIMGNAVGAGDDPARYLSLNFTKKFRSSLGFCHGFGGLIANMSMVQNVMLPAHYHSGLKAIRPFYELAKERLREIGVPEEMWVLRPCDVPHEFQKRALLARAVIHQPVILLLDEPTNDLDVNTMRALEEALENFGGCAAVISHDRWFLDRIATHILAFEGDSAVVWFEGNYSDYEADRKRRLGKAADIPHRIRYRQLTR